MAGKPGRSGRKRQGAEPKVYFNSRIDPDLRDELQVAAEERGRSLSAEIEERLKNSLVPAGKVDDATRALCLLIMEASKEASDGKRNWINDANLFVVFRVAASGIMEMASAASHPGRQPTLGQPFEHPVFKTREEMSRAVMLRIANDLMEAESEPYARAFRALGSPAKWLQRTRAQWKAEDLMKERYRENPNMSEEEVREAARQIAASGDIHPHVHPERLAEFTIRRIEMARFREKHQDIGRETKGDKS